MKWLLFITFFLPTVLHGQDTTTTKNRKFFIGVNFSPDYCYRYITKNDNSIANDQWTRIKNLEDSIYKPTFGYTTGLNLVYRIKQRLSVETGIQYSRKGYKTIPILTVYDFNLNPEKATNYIYFHYLDIPLKANLSFLKSKLQIVTSFGTVLNYLLQVSSRTVPETPTASFQTQTHISKYSYNKINLSPTVSAGLKYNINDKINLRAEPTFSYGLLNTDSKSYAFTHLWTTGLNLSFNYGL